MIAIVLHSLEQHAHRSHSAWAGREKGHKNGLDGNLHTRSVLQSLQGPALCSRKKGLPGIQRRPTQIRHPADPGQRDADRVQPPLPRTAPR